MRQNARLRFVNLPAHYRAASHALLYRRSDAECHTAEVVSRDGGFRPAVPLPAVAILLCILLRERACLDFTRLERVAALWKPLSLHLFLHLHLPPNGRRQALAWSGVERSGTERNASRLHARVRRHADTP